MPKAEPRAARRIQLQRNPALLASLLEEPIATSLAILRYASDTQKGKQALGLVMQDLKKALAQTGSIHTRQTHIARARIRALKSRGAHNKPYPLPTQKRSWREARRADGGPCRHHPKVPADLARDDYQLALEIMAATIDTADKFWFAPTEEHVAQLRPIIPIIHAYIGPMGTA